MPPLLPLADPHSPQILAARGDFLLLYKPPKIHSAPGKGPSLTEWCAALFPEILKPRRSLEAGSEGGLIHRLDYETHGLILFARNQAALENLLDQQNRGEILKYYEALASTEKARPPGFPPFAMPLGSTIESPFRAFGPGRKEVRPVEETPGPFTKKNQGFKVSRDRGKPYATEILETRLAGTQGLWYFRVRLARGFRHQIRCHLAWAGFPILNDPLYGGQTRGKGTLALRAAGIEFTDPGSGEILRYALPPLELASL